MIRRARFQDIPAILVLGREAHRRSRYAETVTLDEEACKRMLRQAIGGPDEPGWGATYPGISEDDGKVNGIIIGCLVPMYLCTDVMVATHLLWYADAPGAGVGVLRAFHEWAGRWPGKLLFQHGVSDAYADPEKIGKIMRRQGLRAAGTLYEKEML